ncbi:hypothetical protein G6F43_007713 [Rhizopus delemar]|nr:hypothetical protein G6F43_007713 [Rhizopus delemar]
MDKFKLDADTTTCIKVPALASEFISTKRLLDQYLKRFYPISPVEIMRHAGQNFKKLNNHHFNPVVLHLISSPKAIKHDGLEAFWSFVIRLPFFKTKMIAASTTSTNFAEKSDVLKKIKDDSPIEFLIHIPGSVQIKAPCFFLSLYGETVAKDSALKIMTSGLKKEIHSQHDTIINKTKKDL